MPRSRLPIGHELPLVEPGQEPGDQPIDPHAADPGAAEKSDDHEQGHGPQLPVDPVARERTNKCGDQQQDADLREQGEIGSSLTRQSHRMIAARLDDGQTSVTNRLQPRRRRRSVRSAYGTLTV